MKYANRSQYEYAKSRCRVRNWAEYEAGLQKRGDLTVWLSDATLDARRAAASGKPGGQRTYVDSGSGASRQHEPDMNELLSNGTMTRLGMPDSYRVA